MRAGLRLLLIVVALLAEAGAVRAAGPKVIGTLTLVGRPGLEAVPIVAFAWSTHTTVLAGGGGAGTGKLAFDDFHVTKLLDATSPPIFDVEASGTTIGEVRIDATIRRGTTASYVLSDVHVTSNLRRAPEAGGSALQELGFSARAIRETVTTPGGQVTSCYDLVAVGPCE